MAWQPTTDFDFDLVEMQPNHNLVHGQWAYEEENKKGFGFVPRPQAHYDYLEQREKRNAELEAVHGPRSAKSKHIRERLEMMERIQRIAGTRPLGENATIADWEDRSTVEKEAIAMMRHFGMMSMADGSLESSKHVQPKTTNEPIKVIGLCKFPLIMDPKHFEPRKRNSSSSSLNTSKTSEASSSSSYFYDAVNLNSSSENYSFFTAKSELETSEELKNPNQYQSIYQSKFPGHNRWELSNSSSNNISSSTADSSEVEIPYVRLEESFEGAEEPKMELKQEPKVELKQEPKMDQAERRRKKNRPNQHQRRAAQKRKSFGFS